MKLYNSKTRKKEIFVPVNNKKVKMYVCGITPYNTTHLGHAFTYVFFDVLRRYLEYKDYKVIYTQNVTDIDDDILKRAKKENRSWEELGKYWTERFLSDMKSLNVLLPKFYVKATDSIALMIRIIKVLINKTCAYQRNGNVYFDVKKFKEYGKLSHYSRIQMVLLSKERGGYPDDPLKKDPLDFVLWQKSTINEPFWESPWSKGRPGWHIECSAMISETLGNKIDIHGGGRDLIFPHHESEIAQSESFITQKPFVKYWLHTSMVLYEGEKMSKSLGNLVMIPDLIKKYSANEIRFVLLSHHYREPWEFDEIELKEAKKVFILIGKALNYSSGDRIKYEKLRTIKNNYFDQFVKAMDNDMQTQEGLKTIERLAKRITKEGKTADVSSLHQALKTILKILGFNIRGN